jgi:transposase
MMNLHLVEISRHVTPGSHAVVLLDGAGWHQTGCKLKLPAYSPELNPAENIWQYLRQKRLL